jgi:hypothetical protein
MPLPGSGQITLNQVNVELGNSGTAQISMNDSAVRALFGIASGEIEMSDGYGKSNEFSFTISSTTQEANLISLANSAGWDGTSALVCNINSGVTLWSDDIATGGLTISGSYPGGVTVNNSGSIMGMGGACGYDNGTSRPGAPTPVANRAGNPAGPAINATTSSTLTVNNNSGAYIAGGGGGGAYILGGGGAGGGYGGQNGYYNGNNSYGGVGGSLGNSGTNGNFPYAGVPNHGSIGSGGGAGGGGGGYTINNVGGTNYGYQAFGGGGGRILPGSGGAAGGSNVGYNGGAGGSAGNVGGLATSPGGGGGGGWGATGGAHAGNNGNQPGGTGGEAIAYSGSYTLSNSGTIYGAT